MCTKTSLLRRYALCVSAKQKNKKINSQIQSWIESNIISVSSIFDAVRKVIREETAIFGERAQDVKLNKNDPVNADPILSAVNRVT